MPEHCLVIFPRLNALAMVSNGRCRFLLRPRGIARPTLTRGCGTATVKEEPRRIGEIGQGSSRAHTDKGFLEYVRSSLFSISSGAPPGHASREIVVHPLIPSMSSARTDQKS